MLLSFYLFMMENQKSILVKMLVQKTIIFLKNFKNFTKKNTHHFVYQ